MIEAAEFATPSQLAQHRAWKEHHRQFFPDPPPKPIEPPAPVAAPPPPPPPPLPEPPVPPRIARLISFSETKARMKVIRRMVCRAYGIKLDELTGRRRAKAIVLPRHVYSYLSSRLTRASLPQIAGSLGQDHTTVLHAVRRIAHLITFDGDEAERVRLLEQHIRSEFGETEYLQQMWPCDCRFVEPRS